MAASGLNNVRNIKSGTTITERWKHLETIVEFALELKKALQCINEQSFNHFVLKMGINHGPITAGVIGATKPHYDIWVCLDFFKFTKEDQNAGKLSECSFVCRVIR